MSAESFNPRRVLVTGAAGFIGYHLSERLLAEGIEVLGIDSLTPYYDPQLKADRLARLSGREGFRFERLDLADRVATARLFAEERFDAVLHLAAQAGVRYSVENPLAYLDSNLAGTMNVLEGCRHGRVGHLVYASSSSVYGAGNTMPLSEDKVTDRPVSLYAASKKANEVMVYSYSHLYDLPATGLRLFTVYGPWGRPDMAIFRFVRAIEHGEPIDVYNHGRMRRDFTYIDDVIEAIVRLMRLRPQRCDSEPPQRILNVGNSSPVMLMDFIACLEASLGREADKRLLPMQPGDVPDTWADTSRLVALTGHSPSTPVREGVQRFVDWYRAYVPGRERSGAVG
ncbi:MAG: NAD-dependent epimerase/dehydratase family protein [Burkholderiales bacterium]|nr:MAG: NAD-dependent epimerase/dehydratase family protein [Burkholderiales bacterium]